MKEGQHPHTHGLNAGDLNRDGKLDLVTVNSNPDNDVSVVLGDGRGDFTRGLPVHRSPSAAARIRARWATSTATDISTSLPPPQIAIRKETQPVAS